MEIKYTDAKNIKSLEDYLISLVLGLISLKTLEAYHVRAMELGILKEDQECMANTLIWDFKRLKKLYFDQAASIKELLPEDFNIENVISKLAEKEMSKARQLVRKPKKKPCDT